MIDLLLRSTSNK